MAGAATAAVAWRTRRALARRLVARAIRFAGAYSRMGGRGADDRPAVAVVRGRLWGWRRSLFHRGTRAGTVGGARTDSGLRARGRAVAPADRATKDRAQCHRAWASRYLLGLCGCDAQDRADR